MLTDEDLRKELAAAFHDRADPVTTTLAEAGMIDAAPLFRQAVRLRHRRASARVAALIVASATAVAAATLATTLSRPIQPAPAAPFTGRLLAAAVMLAPAAAAAAHGMPPFYLVANHDRPVAVIRDSATGRPAGTVRLPAGTDPKQTLVTAAANDRTFILAVALPRGTRLYRLRITPGGHQAALTPLPVPAWQAGESADAIALTADGTRLAVATQVAGGQGTIEVITIATGAVRTWGTTRGGTPQNLSWDAEGRRLGFFWDGDRATGGLWLLDTRAPGTELFSARRVLPQVVGPDTVQSALISPDAHTIIASVTYDGTGLVHRGSVVGGIVAVSARTGRPLKTLLAERAARSRDAGWFITDCALPSIDGTGQHLLVSCGRFGRLDRGRFTAMPGAAPLTSVAATW